MKKPTVTACFDLKTVTFLHVTLFLQSIYLYLIKRGTRYHVDY